MKDSAVMAIIAPAEPGDFYDLVWQGIWAATFDLAPFGVEVRNLICQPHDPAGQQELLRSLLSEELDAIAILPVHHSLLNALIDEHESGGTAVVTFHSDAPASRRSAFVGPNSFQAGSLAGEVLVKLMGGKGQVLSLPGSTEEYYLAQRYEGFRAELSRSQCPVKEVPYTLDLASCSLDPDMDAAMRSAGGFYVGCEKLAGFAALLERLQVSAPCIGFSNTTSMQPYLARRTVSAVIDEGRYQQGYFAVQKAYEAVLKRAEGARASGVEIPSSVIFAANASYAVETVGEAFEMLVRQRTAILCSYKERLEQANKELVNLSITDPLTGLMNRRKFQEVIEQEAARGLRYAPVSLLMIDMNLFKLINDRYGHQVGDEALKAAAQVLKSSCRGTDTCARLGGDEFAVILPHTPGQEATVVRDRILRKIGETTVPAGDEELGLSLSIGLATLPGDADSAETLVAAADSAMYRAKQASKLPAAPNPTVSPAIRI